MKMVNVETGPVHRGQQQPKAVLRIALLQISSCGRDVAANLQKGLAACRSAADQGADIALFPEAWSIGYAARPFEDPDREEWESAAVPTDGEFVAAHAALARELDMAIAVTYQERTPAGPRDTVSVIDREGRIGLTYAKVHTCDFGDDAAYTPGDEFFVCEIDTRVGLVKIGAMICFDRQFPESARVLMIQGAEIILTPNACTLEENLLGQFRARAFENMVGVAMANYPAPFCNGHSTAISPVVWVPDGEISQPVLLEAGPEEGIHIVEFDLDAIRAYRAHETEGNAYRRPQAYGQLLNADVAEPFVRADYRSHKEIQS
jgi:5-aminopentanamidase